MFSEFELKERILNKHTIVLVVVDMLYSDLTEFSFSQKSIGCETWRSICGSSILQSWILWKMSTQLQRDRVSIMTRQSAEHGQHAAARFTTMLPGRVLCCVAHATDDERDLSFDGFPI